MNGDADALTAELLREALNETMPQESCCDDLFVPFGKRAEELESHGQNELANAFRFLCKVSSLRLKPDDSQHPLFPYIIQGQRSAIVDELLDLEIDAVVMVAEQVSNAELRARLSDIAWIRRKNHQLARVAVDAYVESANRLLSSQLSTWAFPRFERAIQIAAMLGKQQPLFTDTVKVVHKIALDSKCPAFHCASALDLLFRHSNQDAEFLARVAEQRAKSTEAASNYLWQRNFWEKAARFYDRDHKTNEANRCRIEIAKTFEREADDAIKQQGPTSNLLAAISLESAIQAYRRVSGTESDRARVHVRLLECQKKAKDELDASQITSDTIDLSEQVQHSKSLVDGKSFIEAIRILALSTHSPDVSRLRAVAEEDVERYPLQFLFGATTMSDTGKNVAKSGGTSSSPDKNEHVIHRQMAFHASFQRSINVVGRIEPIRQKILADHCIRDSDFWPVVSYNAFIPVGREPFFIRGLHAGLRGDFVEALHILIPQIEHSIRALLSERGAITSSIDATGIQNEHDLNIMLFVPRIGELFDEHTIFDLRCLLVERESPNLNFRNKLAHGMVEYRTFINESVVYIWWLILRLCFFGATLLTPDNNAEH